LQPKAQAACSATALLSLGCQITHTRCLSPTVITGASRVIRMAGTTPSNKHPNTYTKDGSPDPTAAPTTNGDFQVAAARRSSFSFLRKRSSESKVTTSRAPSMSRKQKALAQEEALRKQREAAMLPREPPRLPSHSPLPQIASFGGEHRPDSVAIVSNKVGNYSTNFSRPSVEQHRMAAPTSNLAVMPPVPGSSPSFIDTDPYARTESMTNRGRFSYASSQISAVNSPRRVRKKKQPSPFKYVNSFVRADSL